ncbi:hypothetical protein EVAR_93913_1 [Eumeta japonica]|uniref:Uncharacterized protein n=1 Tax=Eumeta variegata TaxID=151549 RepID=A0A4C1TP38_EUMVA|nr:hypothetical protein EVAR_93913_1 [Eumeta japonica]
MTSQVAQTLTGHNEFTQYLFRLCAAAVSLLLGRIGRWSGREIARSALSLARSAQAERGNESCFFMRAAGVHRFLIRPPSMQAKARNKRMRGTIGPSARLVTHLSLFHSIGRCIRIEEGQRPHTTYT